MTNRPSPGIPDLQAVGFDAIGPERIYHYYSAEARLRAVVVIDTLRFGICGGGVRLTADLNLAEVVRLARAMSYKFALLDLPCGGAKAGIWLDPSDAQRARVVAAFVDAIRPLVTAGIYFPGADMGTSARDFAPLYAASGRAHGLGEQEFEGMPLEDQLTGYGVVVAAHAACECLRWPLRGARVAIEGFGKVGAGAAKYFARHAARVVALSTIRGTLHDANGLDVERLLILRKQHGDAALEHYGHGARLLSPQALFTLPVDVLVPGARPDVLNAGNVDALQARLIVPASNIPYAAGAPERLQARSIVALPDFVTNAGGVLAGLVDLRGGTAEEAFALVQERIDRNVRAVLDLAATRAGSAYHAGLAIARERLGVGN
jgi:glutamate dehydrogenase (NAD(P)+)